MSHSRQHVVLPGDLILIDMNEFFMSHLSNDMSMFTVISNVDVLCSTRTMCFQHATNSFIYIKDIEKLLSLTLVNERT